MVCWVGAIMLPSTPQHASKHNTVPVSAMQKLKSNDDLYLYFFPVPLTVVLPLLKNAPTFCQDCNCVKVCLTFIALLELINFVCIQQQHSLVALVEDMFSDNPSHRWNR